MPSHTFLNARRNETTERHGAQRRTSASLAGCLGQVLFPSLFWIIVAHPGHASIRSLVDAVMALVHSYPVILLGVRPQNRGGPITHASSRLTVQCMQVSGCFYVAIDKPSFDAGNARLPLDFANHNLRTK